MKNLLNHIYRFHRSIEMAAIFMSFMIGFYFVIETSATVIVDLIWVLSPYLVYTSISTWSRRSSIYHNYRYAPNIPLFTCNTSIIIFLVSIFSYGGAIYSHTNSSSIFLFVPYYLLLGGPLILFVQISIAKILSVNKSDLAIVKHLVTLSAICSLGGLCLYIGSFLLIVLIASGSIFISGMSEIRTYYITDITGLLGLLGLSISSIVLIRYRKKHYLPLILSLLVGIVLVFHTGINLFRVVISPEMYFVDKATHLIKRYVYLLIIYIVVIRIVLRR